MQDLEIEVKSSVDDRPVQGANVSIMGEDYQTDVYGKVFLKGLTANSSYGITVRADGFKEEKKSIDLPWNKSIYRVTIVLSCVVPVPPTPVEPEIPGIEFPVKFSGQGKWSFHFREDASYGSTESSAEGDIKLYVKSGNARGKMYGKGQGKSFDAIANAYTVGWNTEYIGTLEGIVKGREFNVKISGEVTVSPYPISGAGKVGPPATLPYTGTLKLDKFIGREMKGTFEFRTEQEPGAYNVIVGEWGMTI